MIDWLRILLIIAGCIWIRDVDGYEDYFELKCNGDSWGWSWEDIDFYVQLSGSLPISMETYLKNEGRFNE